MLEKTSVLPNVLPLLDPVAHQQRHLIVPMEALNFNALLLVEPGNKVEPAPKTVVLVVKLLEAALTEWILPSPLALAPLIHQPLVPLPAELAALEQLLALEEFHRQVAHHQQLGQ